MACRLLPSTGNSTNASAQNAMLLPASVAKLYYLSCPYRFSVLWVERRKLIFTVCLTHSKCYICCCQYFILRSKLQKMQLSLHFTDGKTEAQKVSCVSARSGTPSSRRWRLDSDSALPAPEPRTLLSQESCRRGWRVGLPLRHLGLTGLGVSLPLASMLRGTLEKA